MEYTFQKDVNWDKNELYKLFAEKVEKPLPVLQELFDEMKKAYISNRNHVHDDYIAEYGEEEGDNIMNDRYPKPVNIDELPNQAKIISKKYELYGTTKWSSVLGFIVKIPNVRVRVRTYIPLGDYYVWIQKYGINELKINVYMAYPSYDNTMLFNCPAYPHPHISGTGPCLGSFEAPIKTSMGHFNIVGALNNITKYLFAYYGRSTFLNGNEFRPVKLHYTKKLDEFNARRYTLDSWYQANHGVREVPKDKWHETYKEYDEKWGERKIQEVQYHKMYYYEQAYCDGGYGSFMVNGIHALKILLLQRHFNIDDYYKVAVLYYKHAKIANPTIEVVEELPKEYGAVYVKMLRHIANIEEAKYINGWYGHTDTISSDVHADVLWPEFRIIKELVSPGTDIDIFKDLKLMTTQEFKQYLKQFKSIDDLFVIKEIDKDAILKDIISKIDIIYPKYCNMRDSFVRKIIINIDKQKRRMLNEINNPISNSNASQLSFETFSEDRMVGSSVVQEGEEPVDIDSL